MLSRCASCGSLLTDPSGACPKCAASDQLTRTQLQPNRRSTNGSGQFESGTVLAGRYRVVSLLGTGGMGEVYRAVDLRLEQSVALKFLPPGSAQDGAALARLHQEVRMARAVSHPNVCRVYDIGDHAGQHFITMEYIDGEDLRSLLRRIGRVPTEKGLELARGICAGLEAAHRNGLLHRDLKPANVMIDGSGRARITDFGLAAVAGEVERSDVRSGTPLYMAPEQMAGQSVSRPSDIFALGMVLYELFTGRAAFTEALPWPELLHRKQDRVVAPPSSITQNLDPATDAVILRCLDPDPARRPASALGVASALPGGDPVAAALAAGETPSPEMVAQSGDREGLRPAVAVLLFLSIVAGMMLIGALNSRSLLFRQIRLEHSPGELASKASALLRSIGYQERSAYRSFTLNYSTQLIRFLRRQENRRFEPRIASGRPTVLYFMYRESPAPLLPWSPGRLRASSADPPLIVPDMRLVEVDMEGRLLALHVTPPQFSPPSSEAGSYNWHLLFAAAGLNPSNFRTVDPQWTPPTAFDARAAWDGFYPEAPDLPIRIEAAAWRGKPVYFQISGRWTDPYIAPPAGAVAGELLMLGLWLLVTAVAVWIARRHLRLGRGDRRTAFRTAVVVSLLNFTGMLLAADHAGAAADVNRILFRALLALASGLIFCVTYLALEPLIRRRWPRTIVGWSRLVTDGFSDPVVARDVLVGLLVAVAWNVVVSVTARFRSPLDALTDPALAWLLGPRQALGLWLASVPEALISAFAALLTLFLLRVLARRDWLAGVLAVALLSVLNTLQLQRDATGALLFVLQFSAVVALILGRGLLAFIFFLIATVALRSMPYTIDFGAWYGVPALLGFLIVTALAGAACWVVVRDRWSLPGDLA